MNSLATREIRALSGEELRAELEYRALRVDASLCNGPGMTWSDRAVLAEAARRLGTPSIESVLARARSWPFSARERFFRVVARAVSGRAGLEAGDTLAWPGLLLLATAGDFSDAAEDMEHVLRMRVSIGKPPCP